MRNIDTLISEITVLLNKNDMFMIMSDHGFCDAEIEFDLNTWLSINGWLKWTDTEVKGLKRLASETLAYSLLPGRLYFNMKGREPDGHITADVLPKIKKKLADSLMSVKRPDNKKPLFEEIIDGSDLYHGRCSANAPDLVAVPAPGVELKGRLTPGPLSKPSGMQGMHTFDDALIWFNKGTYAADKKPEIIDLYPTILTYFGLEDKTAEGKCIVN